jgi:hypothetical protein
LKKVGSVAHWVIAPISSAIQIEACAFVYRDHIFLSSFESSGTNDKKTTRIDSFSAQEIGVYQIES